MRFDRAVLFFTLGAFPLWLAAQFEGHPLSLLIAYTGGGLVAWALRRMP